MTSLQRVIKYCAIAFAALLIVSIIGGICTAVASISLFFGGDSVGEMQTLVTGSKAEKLDIEISAASLEIVTGDELSLKSNHKHITVKDENGTLKVTEKKAFISFHVKGASVILTVPEGYVFDEAEISAGAGKVTVETLTADYLKLDLGAGAAEIDCLNVLSRGEINGGTGKISIDGGELHNIKMGIGVGKLELTGALSGDCSMDYGVGDAELTLLGSKADYKIKIDKGIGGAYIDGSSAEDGSVIGDGANRIDIDGGIGTIRIVFKEQ